MKKILQINSVVNSGSTGRIAEDIGRTVISHGWKSHIAYGRNDRSSDSELIKIGGKWDYVLHGLKTRIFDKHGLASESATKELVDMIKKIAPDVIHLHNIHGYYLNIKILFQFLKDANLPIVWTLHDCWSITGHCSYFTFVGCEKWKTHCFSCPQKAEYPASWFIDRSEENFHLKRELFTSIPNITLVPVSEWLCRIIKESYLKDFPMKIIHNGINIQVFKPTSETVFRTKYNLLNKFILLGIANIWSPRKGLKDFIELSKMLDTDYKIVLVGLTNKQIEKLPENILGIEKTESVEQLAETYSACDVFINPTYEDNFPTTNIESLACGTPVITYKTGGSPEAINEETGIVVEPGNIRMLIEAINQIKINSKKFYTDACIKRAHLLYNKENRYNEYIMLYESLFS